MKNRIFRLAISLIITLYISLMYKIPTRIPHSLFYSHYLDLINRPTTCPLVVLPRGAAGQTEGNLGVISASSVQSPPQQGLDGCGQGHVWVGESDSEW